jgi:signal transduction histidine kinase
MTHLKSRGRRAGSPASGSARLRDAETIRALRTALRESERLRKACVAHSNAVEIRMRQMSHKLLTAQEEERMRISRELHDAIGQTLTGINVGLAALKNESASDSRELAETISMTQRLVERSMKTVHQFAWELRPTLLDDLGLLPALRSYAKTFAERTGIPVSFAADADFPSLDGERRTALFRVAQGALSNVERHARARRASLMLRRIASGVRLEVRDDGRAFDVRRMDASRSNKHLGLLVMRERVELVGGEFTILSVRGRGTTVRADVPLSEVVRG